MFDVAPSEMLIVAIVALVVIGPKDLPKALRFVGHWVGKARGMARHFRAGLDTMMREAELDEMEKKWREHNEAIMRAYPTIDGVMLPSPAPEATAMAPQPTAVTPVVVAGLGQASAAGEASPSPVSPPSAPSPPTLPA